MLDTEFIIPIFPEEKLMTIGIDASRALRKIKTGTEWYSVEIIKHLVEIDQTNHYILYSNKNPEPPLDNLPKNVSWRVMPFPRGWTLIRLSLEMLFKKPDILFIPAHTLPLIHPKKSVVTIHDIGFIHNPELYPTRQKIYHNFVINFVKNHASHIITPTEYVKQDLIDTLKIPSDKITAIHHGFDKKLYQPTIIANYKSSKLSPYIFYIGRLETKKNILNLIKSYKILRSSYRPEASPSCHSEVSTEESRSQPHLTPLPNSNPKLVLAGKPSHGYDEIEKAIQLSPYKHDIIELGYVPEEEVPIWMSNAAIFSFVTHLEGFGIPIIQAMACGAPAVCSNTTCFPEIADDAAILVNPNNPEQIAKAFQNILSDQKLSDSLIKKGFEHTKKFSWATSAQKTLEVLKRVGES